MKSKITSFIMAVISILIVVILVLLGIIVYNEFTNSDVVGDVQDFVSNIIVYGDEVKENIKAPEKIVETTVDESQPSDGKINYDSQKNDKYYYNQLDEYSKKIYNAMDSNKEKMKSGTYEINLGTQFSDLLSKSNGEKLIGEYYQSAIEAYSYDNPDVFYIEFEKLYLNIETTTRGSKKTYKVVISAGDKLNYLRDDFSSEEEVKSAISEIEKIQAYFVKNKKESTYENIKLVHDYLIETIDYEETLSESNIYNIYGALINKRSVCEGYAKAFKYLMDSIDIPCVLVAGKGTNSQGNTESHAWNYVQLEENWYALDCTWDDPIIIGGGKLNNSSKYKYFLKGEKEFNETHFPNGQFTENGKIFEYPKLSINNYR